MNRTIRFIALLIPVVFASCSTEKNTTMSRNYHNLISHYNIYFNGHESYKRGVNRVEKDFKDNFTRILPLFYYSDPEAVSAVAPDMNRAIEKATKVITLHSITAKPDLKRGNLTDKQKEFYNKKEFNKWVDDNYLLMGKAYIYKSQFKLGVETFKKVVTDFPEEPIRYEALIWMARGYNELGDYRESEKILEMIKGDEAFPEKYLGDLNSTWADLLIKQDQYARAIPKLEKALENTHLKQQRIRFTYILAQLYQETGASEKAVSYYRDVIKMNPPYEMTFNAKINMASSFRAGSGKGDEIESLLRKMLRDDKNIDYQDQIYYALGKIALKQGNTGEAIEYFKQSAQKSVNNTNQKGLTYLALADIYYNIPEYTLAQAYYDSTVQNIDHDYEDYEMLVVKSRSLTNLVKHLRVYTLEDSLQTLAKMSESDRLAKIDQIIEEVRKKEEEERLRKQEEMENGFSGGMTMNRSGAGSGQEGGKWYFYNMNAKSFGQPEFRMRWGNRKLEDNWRRKNKQSVEIAEQNQEAAATDTTAGKKKVLLDNKSREFYLKDIPLTDSAMAVSDSSLENALYNVGLVYRNELKDTAEAIRSFEELVSRYPDGRNSLMGYYNLYELYDFRGNTEKADYFKNLIIRKYPDNPRAKILANPAYAEELMAEENAVLDFYEKTFAEYQANQYAQVKKDAEYALKTYAGNKTIPRFRLLRALAEGGLNGKEAMKEELEQLIADYPGHEVSEYARNLIKEIYSMAPELKVADKREEAEQIYGYNPKEKYFFGVLVEDPADINQMNFNIINFNLDHYEQVDLGILNETIGKNKILFVRSFTDEENANRYLQSFLQDRETTFRSLDPANFKPFIISEHNYGIFRRDQEFAKYYLFFQKYHQK